MTDSLEVETEWFTYSLNLPPFEKDSDKAVIRRNNDTIQITTFGAAVNSATGRLINIQEPIINSAKQFLQGSWEEWVWEDWKA